MRRIVRGIVYIACALGGCACICHPMLNVTDGGQLDVRAMLAWFALGFLLIFIGSELNDTIKKFEKEADER